MVSNPTNRPERFEGISSECPFLHAVRHSSGVAALQIPIARQGPEREKLRIAVVAQVENPRKTGRGVARLIPETILALRRRQVSDAAPYGRMVEFARGDEAEDRPRSL